MQLNTDVPILIKNMPDEVLKKQLESIFKYENKCMEILNKKEIENIENIQKMEEVVNGLNKEIELSKNRSVGSRVGWGFLGVVCAVLGCPLSWTMGVIAVAFLSFAGGGAPGEARPLFSKPVQTCKLLFRRAINNQSLWRKEIEQRNRKIANEITYISGIIENKEHVFNVINSRMEIVTIPAMKNDCKRILEVWDEIKSKINKYKEKYNEVL